MSRYKLVTLAQINLTSAGTRQQVSATSISTPSIIFTAGHLNSGTIFVGDSSVAANQYAAALAAKGSYVLEGPKSRNHVEDLDLSDYWIDGTTTNDDVQVAYLKRV